MSVTALVVIFLLGLLATVASVMALVYMSRSSKMDAERDNLALAVQHLRVLLDGANSETSRCHERAGMINQAYTDMCVGYIAAKSDLRETDDLLGLLLFEIDDHATKADKLHDEWQDYPRGTFDEEVMTDRLVECCMSHRFRK